MSNSQLPLQTNTSMKWWKNRPTLKLIGNVAR